MQTLIFCGECHKEITLRLMTRFEILGRIVNLLNQLDDATLQDVLTKLEGNITDETLDVITYGADDTEHLLSSPSNAEDLNLAVKELSRQDLLKPKAEHAA